MMYQIGNVKSIYWKRRYLGVDNFEDILSIKVDIFDRTGSLIKIDLDDKLKISTASGTLEFTVSEIIFEDDFNEFSKISVIAQSIDIVDIAPLNRIEFTKRLISTYVYKEV